MLRMLILLECSQVFSEFRNFVAILQKIQMLANAVHVLNVNQMFLRVIHVRKHVICNIFSARRVERCTPKRPSIVKCLAVKRSAENALPGVFFLSCFSTSFLPEKRDGKLPFRKCFESVHAGLRDGVQKNDGSKILKL